MKNKKIRIFTFGILIILIAIMGFLWGGNKGNNADSTNGKFTVAYLNSSDDNVFCTMIKNAFIDYGKKTDSSIQILTANGKQDINLQIAQMEEFINKKVNVICINTINQDDIVPTVNKAIAAGIPVIAVNVDVTGDKDIRVVSQDYEAGALQGEYMKNNLPLNAKILYLEGTRSHKNARDRWQGFSETCLKARPDIQVLSNLDGDYSRAEGMKIMSVWLKIFPHFDAVIAGNDEMALGAMKSLQAAGRLNGVLISGVDGTKPALEAIAAGNMAQSVKQDGVAQAQESFNIVEAIKKGEKPPKEKIIPFTSITKENLSQFLQ